LPKLVQSWFYARFVTALLHSGEFRVKTSTYVVGDRLNSGTYDRENHTCRKLPNATLDRVLLPALEILNKHLLHRLVIGAQHVANTVSADQVANFLGEVLSVIAGTLQRLRHE